VEIGVNLRGFVCIVILEKLLGFEDDELVHHVLELFCFSGIFYRKIWERESEMCL
jgi:hypothetical protein